jgi:hypothetical protein
MIQRAILLAALVLAWLAIDLVWDAVQPDFLSSIAIRQFERSNEPAELMRAAQQAKSLPLPITATVVAAGVLIVLWPRRARRRADDE